MKDLGINPKKMLFPKLASFVGNIGCYLGVSLLRGDFENKLMKKSERFIYEDIFMDIYKDIKYKELSIEITLSASRELVKHDKNIQFAIKVLKEGYECSASKRKKGIVEKCLRIGNKEYKAVLVEIGQGSKENIWRLIHFGKKTFKRRRK